MTTPKVLLSAAFLCERIIEDRDKSLSAIRIVDTFVANVRGLPPDAVVAVPLTLLVGLKSTGTAGKHEVTVAIVTPSGKKMAAAAENAAMLPVVLGELGTGANAIFHINLPVLETGLFWIDVQLDGDPLTRVPFKLLRETAD